MRQKDKAILISINSKKFINTKDNENKKSTSKPELKYKSKLSQIDFITKYKQFKNKLKSTKNQKQMEIAGWNGNHPMSKAMK